MRAIESRRLQMTPALYDNVRHRYEHTAEGLHTMAADLGCSAETVRNIATRDGWVRYVPPPRDLSPAAKLAARIGAMAAARAAADASADSPLPSPERGRVGAGVDTAAQLTPIRPPAAGDLPLSGGGEEGAAGGGSGEAVPGDAPPAVAATVDEMHRVVLTELATVKAMRARMRDQPQTPADAEKTARTLHNLMTILREIRLQQAGAAAAAAAETKDKDAHDRDDDYDDLPADIDAFRHEFARRIRAFVESRIAGRGHAGGNAAAPADPGGA